MRNYTQLDYTKKKQHSIKNIAIIIHFLYLNV